MDQEFDKGIRNILQEAPEVDFDPQGWAALHERLAADRQRRPVAYWRWAAVAALWLLPLLALGLWHSRQMQFAGARLSVLEDFVLRQSTASTRTDTVFRTEIVYRTDTVFLLQPVFLPPGSNFPDRQSGISGIAGAGSTDRPWSIDPTSDPHPSGMDPFSIARGNPTPELPGTEGAIAEAASSAYPTALSPLPGGNWLPLDHPVRPLLLHTTLSTAGQGRHTVNPLYYAVPSGFSISAQSGGAFALDQPESGLQTSLHGRIEFGRQLRLVLGAEWLSLSLDRGDDPDPDDHPPVSPINPDDQLHEFSSKVQLWQAPVGLEYAFRPDKHLRPYLGLAWVNRWVGRRSYRYEFKNPSGEYHLNQTFNGLDLAAYALRASGGLEYRLADHWAAMLEGRLLFNLEEKLEHGSPARQAAVQVGVQYRF